MTSEEVRQLIAASTLVGMWAGWFFILSAEKGRRFWTSPFFVAALVMCYLIGVMLWELRPW